MMRKIFGTLLKLWGAASLLVLLLGGALIGTAGWWLRVNDDLKPADAIVLLGGDSRRAVHTADLYLQGLAPVIYTCRPMVESNEPLCSLGIACPTEVETTTLALRLKGVPDAAVRLYGQDTMSTVEEGELLAKLLGPEVKTVIVVTSPHHCRRAKVILSRLLPGRELLFSPPPYERFEQKWWTHQTSARNVIIECAKFLFYALGTPFRSYNSGGSGGSDSSGG